MCGILPFYLPIQHFQHNRFISQVNVTSSKIFLRTDLRYPEYYLLWICVWLNVKIRNLFVSINMYLCQALVQWKQGWSPGSIHLPALPTTVRGFSFLWWQAGCCTSGRYIPGRKKVNEGRQRGKRLKGADLLHLLSLKSFLGHCLIAQASLSDLPFAVQVL